MLGMSIENMTGVSYILFAISGTFAVLAIVIFFLFDIMKCWKVVSKKRVSYEGKQKACKAILPKNTQTERLSDFPVKNLTKL